MTQLHLSTHRLAMVEELKQQASPQLSIQEPSKPHNTNPLNETQQESTCDPNDELTSLSLTSTDSEKHRKQEQQQQRQQQQEQHPYLPNISVQENQKDMQLFLDAILNTSSWGIRNLNVKPGDSDFLLWFICDSYFPLFSACVGPLSIMFSISSIVCTWKQEIETGKFVKDENWLYIVNGVSIFLAAVSNISLLLNFRKQIRYTFSQVISISGWGLASLIMVGAIVGFHVDYMNNEYYLNYRLSYGFWFACFAVVIHFINFVLLLLNDFGFHLKKYKPVFNINNVQKSLMIQSIFVAFWLLVGATTTSRAFKMNFGNAMYYCVNGIITIGAQQYVPANHGSRVLSLFWLIISLVAFGMVAYTVSEMVIGFSQSTIYWNKINRLRVQEFSKSNGVNITSKKSFEDMKRVSYRALIMQKLSLLVGIKFVFACTLLGGGLGFCLLEHWSYGFSVYFCFECLITLGDGRMEPKSPGGRAFFCVWGLGAIPVMSMLISSLVDVVLYILNKSNQIGIVDWILKTSQNFNFFGSLNWLIKLLSKGDGDIHKKFTSHKDDEIKRLKDEFYEGLKNQGGEEFSRLLNITADPLDNIVRAIINTDKIDDLSFLSSGLAGSLTVKTNLAGYHREGEVIDDVAKELVKKRSEFIKKVFQEVDKDFDSSEFQESLEKLHASKPPNLKEYTTMKTKFQKKNDFILSKLSEIQVLIIELEKSMLLSDVDSKHKYTFEEWDRFLRLTHNQDYENDPVRFWFQDGSPFTFPNQEPKYFSHHFLHHIDLRLQKMAIEYDIADAESIQYVKK